MSAKVRENLVLSHAVFTAEVEAPVGHVDIAQWLKTLPTHEYQRCAPPDHRAAGYTVDDDGPVGDTSLRAKHCPVGGRPCRSDSPVMDHSWRPARAIAFECFSRTQSWVGQTEPYAV
jgi:hypothetical protein